MKIAACDVRPSSIIDRPRVSRMLATPRAQVRILCAPVGSGVTTALLEYKRIQDGVAYVVPPPHSGPAEIAKILRSCDGAREILIDGADCVAADGLDALLAFASTNGAPRLLLAGRERSRLRVHTLVARGEAELLDARAFSFDADEIFRLARSLGIDADPDDVAQILHNTEGWAVAVCWLVRDAARERRSLCGAFDIWIEANGYLLREFIDTAIGQRADSATFESVLAAGSYTNLQSELTRLDALGYPIARMRSGLRPYLVLRRIGRPSVQPVPTAGDACLMLKLFGRFSCRVGEREVAFVRRRDRNVLVYLALAPDGRVSRAELASTFWPDVPPAVASQGVRTTLSRLRRAISATAGADADRYLRSGIVVALDLDNVTVDARRFSMHAEQGHAAEEQGDRENAFRHYLFAQRVHAGELLRSEPIEPPLEPLVQRYGQLAQQVSQRIFALRMVQTEPIERRALMQRSPRIPATTFA